MSVLLEFEVGGRSYSIYREVQLFGTSAKTVTSWLRDEESKRILAEGHKTIKEAVKKCIGIDEKTFRYSVFVPQGEIGRILEEIPSNRRKLFAELIGIAKLDKLYKVLSEIQKNFKRKQENLKLFRKDLQEVKEVLEKLKKEKEAIVEKLRNREREKEMVTKILQKIEADLREARIAQQRLKDRMKRLDDLRKEISEKEGQIKDLREKLEELDVLKAEVEKKRSLEEKVPLIREILELDEKISELERLRRNRMELRKKVELLERQLWDSERVEKEYESIKKEKFDIGARINQTEKEIQEMEEEIRNLQRELESLPTGKLEKIVEQLEKKEEKLKMLEKKIGSIEGILQMLEEELKLLRSSKGKCPTCGRPLDEARRLKLIREKSEKIEQLRKEVKIVNKRIFELQDKCRKLTELKEKLERRKEVEEKLAELRTQLMEADAKLEGLRLSDAELKRKLLEYERKLKIIREKRDELRTIQGELNALETAIELRLRGTGSEDMESRKDKLIEEYVKRFGELPVLSFEQFQDLESQLKRLREVKMRLAELKGEKGRLKLLERDVYKLKNELKHVKGEIEELRTKVEDLEKLEQEHYELKIKAEDLIKEVSSLSSTLDRVNREIEESRKTLEKLSKRVKELEKYERAVNLLNQIRESLRVKIKQRYNEKVLTYLRKLIPELLEELGLDFVMADLDGDLNLVLTTSNGSSITFAELSGGEKVLVSLAFRFALLQLLGSSDTSSMREPLPLILDEPTTHLDDEHRSMVIDALRDFYNRITEESVPQMILVSHYSELQNVANKIFTVEKVNGVSRVQSSAQQ